MSLYCHVDVYNRQYWMHKLTNAVLDCHNETLNPHATVEMGEKYSKLLKLRGSHSSQLHTRIQRARTEPAVMIQSNLSDGNTAVPDLFRRSVFKKHNDAYLAHLLLGDRDSRISVPVNGEDRLVFKTVIKDIGRVWLQNVLMLIRHLRRELMDIFPDEALVHLRPICNMTYAMLCMRSRTEEGHILTRATNHLCQAVLQFNPGDEVLQNRLGELLQLNPNEANYWAQAGKRFGTVLEHVVKWVNEQRAADLNQRLTYMSVCFTDEQRVKFLQDQACIRLDLVNERTIGVLGLLSDTKMVVNTAVQRVFQHTSRIEPSLVQDVEKAIRHWRGNTFDTARMDPGLQRIHALLVAPGDPETPPS